MKDGLSICAEAFFLMESFHDSHASYSYIDIIGGLSLDGCIVKVEGNSIR